jgi:hypothetical protein
LPKKGESCRASHALAQLTWRGIDEAGEASKAANRPALIPQTPAFQGQTSFWPRHLTQERYNSFDPVPKRVIPNETCRSRDCCRLVICDPTASARKRGL